MTDKFQRIYKIATVNNKDSQLQNTRSICKYNHISINNNKI